MKPSPERHQGDSPSPEQVVSIEQELQFLFSSRRIIDVTAEVLRGGDARGLLHDAVSAFSPSISLVDSPERFRFLVIAVVPPDETLCQQRYFRMEVFLGEARVGESDFDLQERTQRNPNWKIAGDPRAEHHITPEREAVLRALLRSAHRTEFEEWSGSA